MSYATKTTIKTWAEEDRPREKLILKGRHALSDAELIAILLGMGSTEHTAVELAKIILAEVGNDLNRLSKMSVNELKKFKGVGEAKAVSIVAAMELARRRQATETIENIKLKTSNSVYNHLKQFMLDLDHEQFWMILLKRNLEILKTIHISTGGIAGTVADPKIILRHVIENLANGFIISHNHPSGNLKPSDADIRLTRRLKELADLLEVTLIDHIIFSDNGYYSFGDEGLLS
ncbi:MAG: DNA repair protein RadC [Cytophagaceae bacterium]|nr:DNA repair protein RadC [Cytophagaceae bacterium]MBK9509626.1 DNA repair protein RadC [Cytophagaceae bacterium]MBK9936205.1 DNA repair protein RadC [Cytophagaceae bacterium]MBL0303904.1 DNA repair protein RadC [Cytophagaceae bacterium]MBL0326718.1 DNA repair protein RadC [Cytophagaceae bacterium]